MTMRNLLSATVLLLAVLPAVAKERKAPTPPPLALEGPKPKPVEPPSPKAIDRAIERGIAFLLSVQNENGSWGSAFPSRAREVLAPAPGSHHAFRGAVTALCISALIETGGDDPKVVEALDRAEAWMFENLPKVRRATPMVMYNSWAHAYALPALVKMLKRHEYDEPTCRKIRALIEQQIEMLGRYECVDGGWCYYDFVAQTQKPSGSSISFVTATVLVGFADVRDAGIEVPQRLVDRATASILRQRKPDFSYAYGEYLKNQPMHPVNRPGGSLGRSQACNLAMRLWGDPLVTNEVMETWLDRLAARNLWLDMGRKRPIPHESWFAVAGYFFYYGHYYAALCIEQLDPSERAAHQDQLAHILLRLQEKDGCWWDFPLYNYHRQYGTAMALMSLKRCRRAP